MVRVTLLAAALAVMVGCSAVDERDHAVVARDVHEDIMELQEAIANGASQSEVDQRFRFLLEEVNVLIDSAEDYDSILDRFRSVYDDFDETSRLSEQTPSSGEQFFTERGVPIDTREYVAPVRATSTTTPSRRSDAPLERSNAELRAAAERNVSDELNGILARAELAERRRLDTLPSNEEDEGKNDD